MAKFQHAVHVASMRYRPLALLLMCFTAACGDAGTSPVSGSLALTIGGLPAGVTPAVVVTGPAGFRSTINGTQTLAALPAGSYTIVASDVTEGGVRYAPSPATQTVTIADGALSATPITYAVNSARLLVAITGLPPGASGAVSMTGPGGFSRLITATTQVDLLTPGGYSLTATDVTAGSLTYRPAVRVLLVSLPPSAIPVTATIAYAAGTAKLDVTITGLGSDVSGSAMVAGPNGYARTLTSSALLEGLEAGIYTITPAIVGAALTTYTPSPTFLTRTLVDGGTAAVSIAYAGTPLELSTEAIADGLSQPVFLTAPAGDPRLFIVERVGRIKVVVGGAVMPTPFLDMRAKVNNTGERGLLGMAFDPEYANNGFFYVYYVDTSGDIAVERYGSTPGSNVAGAASGLLMIIPHKGSEHHGGMIAFGPDRMLYFAPGDGGCCGDPQNNAQNLGNWLGKLLRIDTRTVPYTIPANNPFVGQTGMRGEIWAYGLRSPWRFSFDANTGSLYLADVGQDAREEVNVSPMAQGGLNYGWRLMEGSACYNPSINCGAGRTLTPPAYDFPHSDGCSVIGGYVYRGAAIPELAGNYLFADYCKGWVRSFRHTGTGVTDLRTWAGLTLPQIVSFGQDGAGELYAIAQARVYRIVRKP